MEITLFNKEMKAVVTTHGAELIDLRDGDGNAYIWNGDPAYWPGRNPLLFPVVGGLKNNRILLDEQKWQMNRHGFARDQEFQVVKQADDFVVLELKATEETMAQYPRKFVLQVKHSLTEDGFVTEYKVINTDDKVMPFCIGAHTAFRCPLNENECFEDYEIVFDEEETVHNILLNENGYIVGKAKQLRLDHSKHMDLDYDEFAKLDTIIFENLKSTGVMLAHKETGCGIHMEFTGFPMMAFWTKGKERAPFICIEPWHGCAAFEQETGRFEDKQFCIYLEPGQERCLAYLVKIRK